MTKRREAKKIHYISQYSCFFWSARRLKGDGGGGGGGGGGSGGVQGEGRKEGRKEGMSDSKNVLVALG